MTEVADSLRRGVFICQRALSGEILPHQVDAWELWETLSGSSDQLSEPEEYLLYASLLRLIVATVRLQCRWLRYEADELYVDSDIAREKISNLSIRALTSIFIKSFHPLTEVEQLTEKALEIGRKHWDELSGERLEGEILPEEFLIYGRGSDAEQGIVQEIRFQELLDDLENEFKAQADGMEIPYLRFISCEGSAGFPEMVTRSYLGSFLISQGKLKLKVNGKDLKVLGGMTGPRERTHSLAVILKRLRRNG